MEGLMFLFFFVQLALTIYVLVLATRLVNAHERVAGAHEQLASGLATLAHKTT